LLPPHGHLWDAAPQGHKPPSTPNRTAQAPAKKADTGDLLESGLIFHTQPFPAAPAPIPGDYQQKIRRIWVPAGMQTPHTVKQGHDPSSPSSQHTEMWQGVSRAPLSPKSRVFTASPEQGQSQRPGKATQPWTITPKTSALKHI